MVYDDEEEYPEEEDPYDSDKSKRDIMDEMGEGEKEADVYSEEGREVLEESEDELSPQEEGFMEGAELLGEDATCALCGAVLGEDIETDKIVARKIKGKRELFCSIGHADAYEKKHQ